jgi:hypothetical protein
MLPIHYVPKTKISSEQNLSDSLTNEFDEQKPQNINRLEKEKTSFNKFNLEEKKKKGDELWIVEALSRQLPIF